MYAQNDRYILHQNDRYDMSEMTVVWQKWPLLWTKMTDTKMTVIDQIDRFPGPEWPLFLDVD